MEITILTDPDGVWYTPDVLDNMERPEEERVRMLIRPATGREIQRLEEQGLKLNRKGALDIGRRLNQSRAALVAKCVLEIENLPARDAKTGEVRQIITGAQLVELAGNSVADALIMDAVEAIKDNSLLVEGLSKKSG